ncbi:MAG: hypothetical protein MK008_06625 [Bdellovibrionales bacterium]|nr:hypothetical protein [Bdellovibrionales bacterium]
MSNTPYTEENKRRKKALEREEEALKKDVLGEGVQDDESSLPQNEQSLTEKGVERK